MSEIIWLIVAAVVTSVIAVLVRKDDAFEYFLWAVVISGFAIMVPLGSFGTGYGKGALDVWERYAVEEEVSLPKGESFSFLPKAGVYKIFANSGNVEVCNEGSRECSPVEKFLGYEDDSTLFDGPKITVRNISDKPVEFWLRY